MRKKTVLAAAVNWAINTMQGTTRVVEHTPNYDFWKSTYMLNVCGATSIYREILSTTEKDC